MLLSNFANDYYNLLIRVGISVVVFLQCALGYAGKQVQEDKSIKSVLKQVPSFKGGHSVCYMSASSKDRTVQGVNIEGQVRLASVTKLLTSYWVLSRLGPRYRFKTDFVWDSTTAELVIRGSKDPFFGRRRLYLLISELNRLGIRQINKVYFDEKFKFFLSVENPSTHHTEITQSGGVSRQTIKAQLLQLMNNREWKKNDRAQYSDFVKIANVIGVKATPSVDVDLKVLEVEAVTGNPLEGRAGLEVYSSASPEVLNYLKVMNMYSMNYPADEFFTLFGGRHSFAKFLMEKMKVSELEARIFTGSGLPYRASGDRADTYTSCEVMLGVLEEIKKILNTHKLDLSDIMMVAGVDRGTLSGPFREAPLRGTVVAKTGTIATALTLAGYIYTKQGRVDFGIFFQTKNLAKAKTARNQLVLKIAGKHGGTQPLNYHQNYQFVSFAPQSELKKLDSGSAGLP